MKIKIKKVFFFVFILLIIYSNAYSQDNSLFGKWQNIEKSSNITSVEFKNDNTIIMFQEDKISPPFVYTIDYSKKPIWVDMSVEKNEVRATILGLLDYIDVDKIKIELFYGSFEDHPIHFSISETVFSQSYILNRIK